jgi:hypothetical protein
MATITQPIDITAFSAVVEKRKAQIAERARPNPNKPRLPDAYENMLTPLDAKTAECYSTAEELTYQWAELAALLSSD